MAEILRRTRYIWVDQDQEERKKSWNSEIFLPQKGSNWAEYSRVSQ